MGFSPAPMGAHRGAGGDHPGSWRGGAAPVGRLVCGLSDDAHQVCRLMSRVLADRDTSEVQVSSRVWGAGLPSTLLSADLLHACKEGHLQCMVWRCCMQAACPFCGLPPGAAGGPLQLVSEHNHCLWCRVGPGESPVMYWAQDWVLGVLIVKTLYRCAREEQLGHAPLRQLSREADLCLSGYLHDALWSL